MKQISCFLFVSILVLCSHNLWGAAAKSQIVKSSALDELDEDQCGGVLEVTRDSSSNESVSSVGVLEYKFQKEYRQWESCVWTVHAPNSSLIKFNFTNTYFIYSLANNYDYLSIGYFNKSNYDQLNSFTWIKIDALKPQPLEVPGPVAFIHFQSTVNAPGLGFRLTYEASGEESSSIYNFENYFLQGKFGAFKYPVDGASYRNNQRTTIVVKANSGLPLSEPYPSKLIIKNIDLENSNGCLVDSLNIYGYGHVSRTWNKNDTRCGVVDLVSGYYFYHPRNDPIILTFLSDDSGVGSGFEIFWRNYHTN